MRRGISTWHLLLGMGLAGYGLALSFGHLDAPALPWLGLLLIAAVAVRKSGRQDLQIAGHLLFIVMTAGLALHLLPGFGNAAILQHVRNAPDTVPYSLYLNLDKPLIGLWLLLACPWIVGPYALRQAAASVPAIALATLAVCLGLAWGAGWITWAPGLGPAAALWIASNLLLTCLTEEALFRGYVQGGLTRQGGIAARCALPASALLFGLAHAPGGWPWILLAGVAGLGYGIAYRHGGLAASVAVHFIVNLAHYGLFSYPMLVR